VPLRKQVTALFSVKDCPKNLPKTLKSFIIEPFDTFTGAPHKKSPLSVLQPARTLKQVKQNLFNIRFNIILQSDQSRGLVVRASTNHEVTGSVPGSSIGIFPYRGTSP
jgi:hypothetical protein